MTEELEELKQENHDLMVECCWNKSIYKVALMQRDEAEKKLKKLKEENKKLKQKLKDIRSSIPMIVDGSADIFNEIIAIINRK